jgi:hypothetical protein
MSIILSISCYTKYNTHTPIDVQDGEAFVFVFALCLCVLHTGPDQTRPGCVCGLCVNFYFSGIVVR